MRLQSILTSLFLFLVSGFAPALLIAEPYQQDDVTGHVVFEAERADANIPRGGYSWAANFTAGYSADSGLQTSPASGPALKDPGYSLLSPQLDYQVNFVQTGTHYVWVRGIGSQSNNNSVHVGLDGNEVATSEALNFPVGPNWVWHGGIGVASFNVDTLGAHTVNVWMRETGFRIDKLIVTTNAGFTPSGISLPESPRGSGGGGANQMPVADAGGPYSGVAGSAITFDGSASFDPDAGDTLTYSWDFGDGGTGSGVSPSHTYATDGGYTVTLTVNDGLLDSLDATAAVTVDPAGSNQPPVADAGGPYMGVAGAAITFDGSASFDPDAGDTLTYSWDFGDGGTGSGVSPSHTYATDGGYTITLTVNDGTVDSPAATAAVTVDPAGGSGTVGYLQDGVTGHVVFEAERADANIPRGGYSWADNFTAGYSADSGLRTSPTTGAALKDPGYSSLSPQLDYQVNFVQTGTHYVWVRGIGDRSSNNSVHVGLDGNEVATSEALNFPVGPNWVWHGGIGVASFNVDTLGAHTVNVWMRETGFRIDKLIVTTNAGFTPSGISLPESPRGSGGGGANQMPVADAGGPYTGVAGSAITFDGSASFDPDAGDTLTYSWDFGDGGTGSGVSPSHTYATDGGYTVTLTVNDGLLDSLDATAAVTVDPAGSNQPPVADAGGPYMGVAGAAITFDGSASFDPDAGDTLTYSWDFGDGGTGSGVSPSHTYATDGGYTVTLTVNDGTVDSPDATATVTVDPAGGSGAVGYLQDGITGHVVFEAEHADANIPRGGYSWADNFTAGYSADSGLRTSPTTGAALKDPGYSSLSPQLDYQVNFVQTGTHYVWVRGIGDRSSNNSVHVGLDGNEVATSEALNFPVGPNWVWHGGIGVASFNVDTLGAHTVNVWMRETGFRIDKLIVTTNAGFTPSGISLPESPRGSGGTPPVFADDFNDGNAIGWSVDDECLKGSSNWAVVNNELMQTGECRGFSLDEGFAIGTNVLSSVALPAGVDINLRLRSEDPASDAVAGNNGSIWKFGSLGVLFGYQDAGNYYRFEFNGLKGHRKLLRRQGGAFTELNTSPQSFVRGQWMDLRIVHQNGVILVYVDGQQVMSAVDATFSAGALGLFCARDASCSFDDISVLNASTDPQLGLRLLDSTAPDEPALPVQSYSEYFVDSDGVLDVVAVTTSMAGIGGVEFVVDEGVLVAGAPVQVSVSDLAAPYRKQITPLVSTGEHTVTAYLLDGSGVRMTAPAAKVTLPRIATNGIHLYTQGDSITEGLFDDLLADNTSIDTRNTAGGYQPPLNDYLSGDNSQPVTVLSDGNSGETSWEGAARIVSTLARNPEAQAYVMFYGANDSGGSMPTPPFEVSLDETPDTDNPVTFKDYLQKMINEVVGAGKQIYLVKAPPYFANLTRDGLVQQYNQVVDRLIFENGLGYVAADLHDYFTLNPGEYAADGIHPDGDGYASIARKICEQLNGEMGLTCIP